MVYLSTSEEWQHQSSLLLQARPTTTRITTKYKVPNLSSDKYQNAKKRKRTTEGEEKEDLPRAVLVLKTYDPQSGVCLKLKTDRQADVGRLIMGLGRLGRYMAALPEKAEDTVTEDLSGGVALNASEIKTSTPAAADAKPQQTQAEGTGGNKKKKKRQEMIAGPRDPASVRNAMYDVRSHETKILARTIEKCPFADEYKLDAVKASA